MEGPITRLGNVLIDADGRASLHMGRPVPQGRSLDAGERWYAQLWFRDQLGGGSGFNTSNALELSVAP